MSISRTIIGLIYQRIFRPIFFLMDPELVHNRVTTIGRIVGKGPITRRFVRSVLRCESSKLEQEVLGIKFKNPVGLSAGFDKDANLQNILPAVGFGFAHLGSVTLNPYEGNPKPRLYRLQKSKGVVVYYGLKNIGVEKVIIKLKNFKQVGFPLGISVAKTNSEETVSTAGGIKDYYECLKKLIEVNIGDYYIINISCPNTFGGEPFTTLEKLTMLLEKLTALQVKKPMFVKMPINLEWPEFKGLLDVIVRYKLRGVVIGNLTKVRDPNLIKDDLPESIKGGISGKPTWDLSNDLISKTYKEYGEKLVIIGVGGVFSAEDAYEKIKRGATLVGLITGMIYKGPQLIGEINEGLVELLEKDGFSNISEAVGVYHK